MLKGPGALGIGILLALAACSSDQTRDPLAPRPSAATSAQAAADTLARLLAGAMQDAAVRSALRDALRASPYVEHKVVLDELVASPAGQMIVAQIARSSGRSESAVLAIVAKLPGFEVYMSGSEYRRAWRGGPEVAVAAAATSDRSVLHGYFPNGSEAVIHNGDGYQLTMRPATLYLAPTEGRTLRISASQRGARTSSASQSDAAIEDAGEQTWGGSYVVWTDGVASETSLASNAKNGGSGPLRLDPVCDPYTAVDGCPDGTGSSPTPPPPPPPQVYLSRVNINSVCDNSDCTQNNEFEWHTYAWNGSSWVSRRDIKLSLPSTIDQSYGNTLVANSYPPGVSSQKIQSDIVETDPDYLSPDDKFLPSPQWYPGESGVQKGAGDPRCYMNAVDAMTNNCRWYPASEVMTTMLW